MWKHAALVFSLTVISHFAYAQEHEACRNIDFSAVASEAPTLREIAATCDNVSISRLYYNRAHLNDLYQQSAFFSRLISVHGDKISSYRMYMALTESLAPVWFPDAGQRVDFLNREYERVAEVAELRLKGFDRLADVLERRAYLH